MYVSVGQKLPEIWLENQKKVFYPKPYFVKNDEFSLQKRKNRQIDTITFLAISLAIFELHRRTISHFNPLNISFWPLFITFSARINIFWDMKPNVCLVFFSSDFSYRRIYVLFFQLWRLVFLEPLGVQRHIVAHFKV